MANRKTAAERRQAEFYAEIRAEEYFKRSIRSLSDFKEAWDFAQSGPRSGEPGGSLYTNLGYYLYNHQSPDAARAWEQELHAELGKKIWPTPAKSPNAKSVASLTKGSKVTIRGRVQGLVMNVLMKDCEIVQL